MLLIINRAAINRARMPTNFPAPISRFLNHQSRPRCLSRRLANMRDCDVVAVEAFPIGQAVEQCDSRTLWCEQRRADFVFLEKPEKVGQILERHCTVVPRNEGSAIELGASIDERWDARADHVAAEAIVVENWTCLRTR